MRNFYKTAWKRSGLKTMALFMAFGLLSTFVSAQTELSWTGATDSDASEPSNWDPPSSIFGNILNVDSAYKFTNQPVLTLSGDTDPISMINVRPTGVFTIADAANPSLYLDINNSNNSYLGGSIVLQAGNVSWRKTIYLEDSTANLTIEGGMLRTRSYLSMGTRDLARGGSIDIKGDGRLVVSGDIIRFSNDTTKSIITITENGILEKSGDWVGTFNTYIGTGQIRSDDNFDPYTYYDADNAITYITLRSKDTLFLQNTNTINVLIGEEVPAVKAVENRGFENLVSKEWKYATESGGTLMSFSPAQTGDSLYQASFDAAGNYFVVLTGNDGTKNLVSDEVQVGVTSDMLSLDPIAEQTIRVGWTGGMVTATSKETPTSLEWKYSSTSGGPYSSFADPVTVNEYIPDFDAPGIYYIVCEAVVNGNTHLSPELTIKYVERNAPSQAITWTGAYSNDVADNRNYDPMMHPWFNDVTLPSRDWIENPPTLSTSGNDTIKSFWMYDSAYFVIDKPAEDTLVFTGDCYQTGKYVVESGIINYRGGYVRLDDKNAGVTLKGTSQFIHNWTGGFIIGNADNGPRGGQVLIQDDAYMRLAYIWRWSADSLQSVITIRDNGLLELDGDQVGDMASRIANNQVKTVDGFTLRNELKIVGEDTTTVIYAKSEVAFDIAPLDLQYAGVGMNIAELSTVNDDGITSREWKYTTTSGSDYVSFSPAETGSTLSAAFDAAGTYYVICEGSDGTETYTSDEVSINVVSVEVTPADAQALYEWEEGDLISVTESIIPDSREWKYSTTSGSGYGSFAPARLSDAMRPLFSTEGTYYVVCESVYGSVAIVSNEVEVVVTVEEDTTGVNQHVLPMDVYPNPSNGNFYVNVKSGDSFSIEIYDVTGKALLRKEFNNVNGPQPLNLNTQGVHILKVVQGDIVRTEKIIIK